MKKTYLFLLGMLLSGLCGLAQNPSFLWAERIFNTGSYKPDRGADVDADQNGFLYVTGDYYDTLVVANDTLFPDTNSFGEAFVLKAKPDGTPLWGVPIRTRGIDWGTGLSVSAAGDKIFLTGQLGSYSPAVFGDAGSGMITKTFTNFADYVACIDSSGQVLWAVTISSTMFGQHPSITIDNQHVYVSGTVYDNSVFSVNAMNGTMPSGQPGTHSGFYILKLDMNGNHVQHVIEKAGGWLQYRTAGLTYSPAANALFVAGSFRGCYQGTQVHYPNGLTDFFVAKYSTNLQPQWFSAAGGGNDTATTSMPEEAVGIAADAEGGVLVSGCFSELWIVGNDTLNGSAINSAHISPFIAEFDGSGQIAWAEEIVTSGLGFSVFTDVEVGHDGTVYWAGVMETPVSYQNNTLNGVFPQSFDFSLMKTDSLGNFDWFLSGGTVLNDYGQGVCIGGNGEIVITGGMAEMTYWQFDTLVYTASGNNNGYYDVVFAKIFDPELYVEENPKSIAELNFSNETLSIYPNPSTGQIQVAGNFPATITVYDLAGRTLQRTLSKNGLLDISSYADGCYVIAVQTEEVLRTARVILSR